jgi:hypothetical protein
MIPAMVQHAPPAFLARARLLAGTTRALAFRATKAGTTKTT